MINLDQVQLSYLIGAIILLAISIAVYPTLRERSRKSHKK